MRRREFIAGLNITAIWPLAAPPISVMNARRFMANPKLRRWHLSGSNRYLDRG
jgi:hypothetical protein